MILLVGLFIGLICGLVAATKAGFASSWARLLNTAVAVYVAVYATPTIASSAAIINEHFWGAVLCAFILFVMTFIILNAICMVIMGDLKIEMPKLLDTLGGGILGFANGVLAWGFICLLFCISPLAGSSTAKQLCSPDEVKQMWSSAVGTNMAVLDFVTMQDNPHSVCKVVDMIVTHGMPKPKAPKEQPVEEEVVEEPAETPASETTNQ